MAEHWAEHWADLKDDHWVDHLAVPSVPLSVDRKVDLTVGHWVDQWAACWAGQMAEYWAEHWADLKADRLETTTAPTMVGMLVDWIKNRIPLRTRLENIRPHPSRSGTRPERHQSCHRSSMSRWHQEDRKRQWIGRCTHRQPNTRHTMNYRSDLTADSSVQTMEQARSPRRRKVRCMREAPSLSRP